MQVHDTPLLLDAKGATQVVTVGAGGADIYHGPSPATATRLGGGTLVAAGSSFSITGATWVVRSDQSRAPAADVSMVDASSSVGSSGPASLVYYGSPTDSDGATTAHPEWAGKLKSAVTPQGTSDQMTYDSQGRLVTYRENGVARTLSYDATSGLLTGVA